MTSGEFNLVILEDDEAFFCSRSGSRYFSALNNPTARLNFISQTQKRNEDIAMEILRRRLM